MLYLLIIKLHMQFFNQDDEIQSQAATINQLKQQIADMEDVSRFTVELMSYINDGEHPSADHSCIFGSFFKA